MAGDTYLLGYINKDGVKGCLDAKSIVSCFEVNFGKIVFVNAKQESLILKDEWVYIEEGGIDDGPWWVKGSGIVLQSNMTLLDTTKFPIESYKWDGGEARYEYYFTDKPIMKSIHYDREVIYQCLIYSGTILVELRCIDPIRKSKHTEIVRLEGGVLESFSCGEWCEIKYRNGKLDVKRFR